MNTINEIKEMLDKLNGELENLRAENKELKLRLSKYESITENNTDSSTDMSSTFDKEELYELGESIINHTAKNEVQAISRLMYCWANNKKKSKTPGEVIRMIISSQSLSEKNLEIICNFIVSTIKEKYTSRFRKPSVMPPTHTNMILFLLDNGNLNNDMFETLLDIAFEHSSMRDLTRKECWFNHFSSSSRYEVEKDERYNQWTIQKKS